MKCRHCSSDISLSLVDLGASPPSNSYLTEQAMSKPEIWYPLRVVACSNCWLVQTEDFAKRDEFFSEEYAYFSSFSDSWLRHSDAYVSTMVSRFKLDAKTLVVEVASNDGYLLQFAKARGIPTLGIEPTASTARAARKKGLEVIEEFFGVDLASRLVAGAGSADLIAANNVLAHVPDINDFVSGFSLLLTSSGVATFEFPHLMQMIEQNQFDTIYHEHYSYLSFTAVVRVFNANGLSVFDVEQIPTHGGSLRVFAQRIGTGTRAITIAVGELLSLEASAGVATHDFYRHLQRKAEHIADELIEFLIKKKREGKLVVGYGAAAKGNTLINFAGVRPHLLPWVVDRNPAKQKKYLPGQPHTDSS